MAIDIGFTVETVKVLSDMTEQQTKHINKLETDARALKDEKAKLEVKKKKRVYLNIKVNAHHVDH